MSRPAVPTHTGRTLTRLIPILSLSRVPEAGHPVPSALIGKHPDSPPETYPNPGADSSDHDPYSRTSAAFRS